MPIFLGSFRLFGPPDSGAGDGLGRGVRGQGSEVREQRAGIREEDKRDILVFGQEM